MNDAETKNEMRLALGQRWAELWPEGASQDRPPVFSGVGKAAQRLRSLPQYRLARNICIMPDPVLLQVRINALQDGKNILAVTPGLKQGFVRITPNQVPVAARSRDLRGGALFKAGRPLRLPENIPGKVDLIIAPAMAADPQGNLLGDGRGLYDLCYALLSRVGSVGGKTNILALVDQQQIVESVPHEAWDVPAGWLITAEKTISTGSSAPHPAFWGDMPDRMTSLPVVQAVEEFSSYL